MLNPPWKLLILRMCSPAPSASVLQQGLQPLTVLVSLHWSSCNLSMSFFYYNVQSGCKSSLREEEKRVITSLISWLCPCSCSPECWWPLLLLWCPAGLCTSLSICFHGVFSVHRSPGSVTARNYSFPGTGEKDICFLWVKDWFVLEHLENFYCFFHSRPRVKQNLLS